MDRPFIISNEKGIAALKFWLREREYNTWTLCRKDKKGNPIIGISFDWKPDSDWGKAEPRGLIVIRDVQHETAAYELVEKYARQ